MNTQREWWENFFSDLLLDFQVKARADEITQAEANFIQKMLGLVPQARVLDVPCGEGRHAIALAAHGYMMTGIDITLPLLERAQTRAAEQQLEIRWEHRDMRNLPWQAEFDGAFCFWGSFGYFDAQGNVDFLKAIARAIKPGAKFLLDTHVTETLLPKLFQERSWKKVNGMLVLEERHYDHEGGRTNTEFTLIQEGEVIRKSCSIQLYSYRELCGILEQLGFTDFQGYGTLSGEPFRLGSPRLYLVATRP